MLARPLRSSDHASDAGKRPLGLGRRRDGYLYAPAVHVPGAQPLLVFLHGSGGDATQADVLLAIAEKIGLLILSIDSRRHTWDLIRGNLGPDVEFLDSALRLTFERHAVDPRHVALAGFSDGASYALSLGLANGHLFSHVIAFSPGFASPPAISGSPRLFVSHGTADPVLPIDACSRKLVPRLRRCGYLVDYREIDGGHRIPARLLKAALEWLVRPRTL